MAGWQVSGKSKLILQTLIISILFLVLPACGSASSSKNKLASTCSEKAAIEVTEIFISPDGFSSQCARASVGKQLYFVNHDEKQHSIIADNEKLDTFDATLDSRDSTYPHTFEKAGKYSIHCREHNETLTLFVV